MNQHFTWEGGNMQVREHAGRVELQIEQQNEGRGLYKAWLRGAEGASLSLGSLMPEQNRLLLRRTLARDELARLGCWPIAAAGATLSHRFTGAALPTGWQKEPQPQRLFPHDAVLQESLASLHSCLLCHSSEGFSIALPYAPRNAFPLPALFCFARLRQLGEGTYAVFPFDPEGQPRF